MLDLKKIEDEFEYIRTIDSEPIVGRHLIFKVVLDDGRIVTRTGFFDNAFVGKEFFTTIPTIHHIDKKDVLEWRNLDSEECYV